MAKQPAQISQVQFDGLLHARRRKFASRAHSYFAERAPALLGGLQSHEVDDHLVHLIAQANELGFDSEIDVIRTLLAFRAAEVFGGEHMAALDILRDCSQSPAVRLAAVRGRLGRPAR